MAFEYCPVSRKVLDISPSPRHSAPQLRRLRLAFQSILSIKGNRKAARVSVTGSFALKVMNCSAGSELGSQK